MRSVALPVFWAEPWPKLVEMPASLTPRPTWLGLVPPSEVLGMFELRRVWLRVSSKTAVLVLKPVVLTLEMLLLTTSISVWWARRPVMPEKRERSTVSSKGRCEDVRHPCRQGAHERRAAGWCACSVGAGVRVGRVFGGETGQAVVTAVTADRATVAPSTVRLGIWAPSVQPVTVPVRVAPDTSV